MTGTDEDSVTERRATVETPHGAADIVAAAIAPDNTDEIRTTVDGGVVRTTVERPTTGGLASSVDDYVVNLDVADRVLSAIDRHTDTPDSEHSDTESLGSAPGNSGTASQPTLDYNHE